MGSLILDKHQHQQSASALATAVLSENEHFRKMWSNDEGKEMQTWRTVESGTTQENKIGMVCTSDILVINFFLDAV